MRAANSATWIAPRRPTAARFRSTRPFADANNGLGVVLVQRKRPDDAIEFLEQAVASDPHLYEAQLNLGIAYQESGDRGRAADTYQHVLDTAPASATKERKAAATLLAGLR